MMHLHTALLDLQRLMEREDAPYKEICRKCDLVLHWSEDIKRRYASRNEVHGLLEKIMALAEQVKSETHRSGFHPSRHRAMVAQMQMVLGDAAKVLHVQSDEMES